MNYRQCEIFVTTLEAGSVTAAAQRLSLSQPAVSKSLKMLEAELGVRLFKRGAKGLNPTDEGRSFYLEAARMTESFGHLESFAQGLARLEHARLEISCIPALSTGWLPGAIRDFLYEYSDLSLSFRSVSSPETVQRVARGELDIGISQARSEDLSVDKTVLFDLHAVCVLPTRHRLCREKQIRLDQLSSERLLSLSAGDEIRRKFEASMLMAGLPLRSQIEVAIGAMLCRMVADGHGIGVVDEESAKLFDRADVVVRPLAEPLSVPIYLLQNPIKPQTLIARKFVEHLLDVTAARRNV
ncbi:LysR family transcriptional regulator [Salipiger sp. 1_MG-2023]|uniref:LysR family transcriptional regulator n=1 Tax=Salipiger sp. 1_MG-2023 TaxID=3062665 RepID=UPI0026E28A19|nr:LysR family transcriptional regulator [Salipiger sp. 1_MG-2023]MDO6585704.1 LysR family transcriptional regulator [Salipiger sp. 1_MG-2023]